MSDYLLQFIVVVIVLFAASRVLLRFYDGKISLGECVFWTLLWVATIILTFVPSIMSRISQTVGIKRGLDLVVPLALIVLFYLVFRAYIKVENVEQELTQVVRKVALDDIKVPKKKR